MLKHHYPGVPNLGDVTKITLRQLIALGHVDLIVFGSPCQDLSVAGKRKGLSGARSGLFHDAMRIVDWLRTWCGLRWAVWENVPGAFSSNEGRDFAIVVDALAGMALGTTVVPQKKKWGNEGCVIGPEAMVEWSTLDAQWFGVAQRRRRVFAVADFGDWASRPPILLEPESLRGDFAPRRGTGESVAGTLEASAVGCDESLDRYAQAVAYGGGSSSEITQSTALTAHPGGRLDFESETFIAYMPARTFGADGGIDEHFAERDIADALHTSSGSGNKAPIIAFNHNAQVDQLPTSSRDTSVTDALTCSQGAAAAGPFGVRRLTPLECERLQAFRDGYTAIPCAKDGPRYKALGNSMCTNVMRWIGQRIDTAQELF